MRFEIVKKAAVGLDMIPSSSVASVARSGEHAASIFTVEERQF